MAFKFDEITFNLKDIILIIGVVSIYFDFKAEQKESYNELKLEIKQIVAESKIHELKINAKFDELQRSQFSKEKEKQTALFFTKPDLVAICNRDDIKKKKKKLFKPRLI